MKKPVYMDYAATTPVDPRVADVIMRNLTLDGTFGNPASRSHVYGWQAEEAVENARAQVAELIGADVREIVWTSGATEANNLAIKGAAFAAKARSAIKATEAKGECNHIITSKIEHKAVLDTCAYLETQGFSVTYLTPEADGLINPDTVAQAITENTILVSLMHVNNEIGVVNNIAAIGQLCREKSVIFHVDAAQSAGKELIDVKAMNVDLMSISAHKMYGPKGVGVLYIRRTADFDIDIQIHGGGHERGFRSGTLATHQIAGMGQAAELCSQELESEKVRIASLRDRFLAGISVLPGITINGTLDARIAHNLNVSFAGVEGETLLMSLRQLAVSTGSACVSVSVEPSYVLRALGVDEALAHASIRFSLGRFTTEEEIDFAITTVVNAVTSLRKKTA